jgi:uncharacterized protein
MTMTNVTNETALITGASSGIGAVYADRLAKRGYDLVLTARDTGRMETLAARLRDETGVTIEVIGADLTKREDVAAIEARLAKDDVTLFINNAGMSMTGNLLTAEPAQVETLIAVNISAPTLLAAAAGKAFGARGKGAIVNVASVLAFVSDRFDGTYNATKSHLLTISRWLNAQLKDQGVYSQALVPAVTRTEIWERSGQDVDAFPSEIVMSVEDLVDAALVGFDRREEVTIPPLADESLWTAYDTAREQLIGGFLNGTPAPRYREPALA